MLQIFHTQLSAGIELLLLRKPQGHCETAKQANISLNRFNRLLCMCALGGLFISLALDQKRSG